MEPFKYVPPPVFVEEKKDLDYNLEKPKEPPIVNRQGPETQVLVITSSIRKESDEPFCDYCIKKRVQEVILQLGLEEEQKPKSPPQQSELDVLRQRNQLLEQHAMAMSDAINTLNDQFLAYQKQTEERMNKLARLTSLPGAM